ncbi:isopeptide-forming domain-containing fimbrial protein [uncultured Secundilactobacillus sp.]|uniref:isopeptide-forming domain-containing fimbrial protein n=1 Tax=uncultured Secundilactobacillus sp. TaxID=2813935 RepID=UPI00258469C7|nr:isopeptide-forming domain-containing fimbrial protein [uncultured Secundilactobacillus sp.]
MKQWQKLLTTVAVMSSMGLAAPVTTALAATDDASSATSSTSGDQAASSSDAATSSATSQSDSTADSSSISSDAASDSSDDQGTTVTFGDTKTVKAGDDVIWHAVFTPGNTVTDMKDLTFSDPLDAQLEYQDAKVLQVKKTDAQGNPTAFGKDITKEGELSFDKATNTVSWTPKTPATFRYAANNDNSTIDLVIKAKVKAGTKDGTIPNTAVMTLGGQTYKTNQPSVKVDHTAPDQAGTPLDKQIANSPLGKKVAKLAKTGVRATQAHPIIAAVVGLLMASGLGTWGYRLYRKRQVAGQHLGRK